MTKLFMFGLHFTFLVSYNNLLYNYFKKYNQKLNMKLTLS